MKNQINNFDHLNTHNYFSNSS